MTATEDYEEKQKKEMTQVQLSRDTLTWIKSIGKMGDSYDSVLQRLKKNHYKILTLMKEAEMIEEMENK